MTKQYWKILVVIVIFAAIGGAFYGGMKYGGSKNSRGAFFGGGPQDFRNLSAEERDKISQQFGSGGARVGFKGGANTVAGEIISKDDKSVTIKLPNGGSKIIFFSDSTTIIKSADGSINDIEAGKQIIVNGEQNSDGSYTAKTIQISPQLKQ